MYLLQDKDRDEIAVVKSIGEAIDVIAKEQPHYMMQIRTWAPYAYAVEVETPSRDSVQYVLRNMTIDELAKRKELKVYDTALPIDWVEAVSKKLSITHLDILGAGFVWCYDEPHRWGTPYPLTPTAEDILTKFLP